MKFWALVKRHKRFLIGLGLLSSWLFANAGVFANIDGQFQPMQAQWSNSLRGAATKLFWSLVAIDFAWHSAAQVMETGELESVLKGLMKRIFRYGMFFALLRSSDTYLPAIIESFRQMGSSASGSSAVTPDAIVALGLQRATDVFEAIGNRGLVDTIVLALPMMFLALVIYACFLFVALQILITQIEIYLVCGAGIVLLGFGGSVWTKDMAVNLYKYAVQVGMKLLILMLVIGIGMNLTQGQVLDSNQLWNSVLTLLGSTVIFAYLAVKAPALANGMLTGSGSLSAGDMAGTAVAMAAGTAAAAGGAVAAGAMAQQAGGNALAGAAGLGQAVGAGLSSAADHGKTGMGAAMHAASEVAAHGLSMGGAAVSSAAAGAHASFGESVAGSTGGKIAQSIEGTRGGSMGQAAGSGSSAASPAPAPASAGAPAGGTGAAVAGSKASGGGAGGADLGSHGSGAQAATGQSPASGAGLADAAGTGATASGADAGQDSGVTSTTDAGQGAGVEGAQLADMPGAQSSGGEGSPAAANAPVASSAGAGPQATAMPEGNAAGATLQGGSDSSPASAASAGGGRSDTGGSDGRKMHERILGHRDFLPQDAVPAAATAQINTDARAE